MTINFPKCENPDCCNNVTVSINTGKPLRYCSRKCSAKCNSINGSEKRKVTNLKKFGHHCNLLSTDTKTKIKQTNLIKRGVDHAMKAKDSVNKLLATKKEKYGDSTYNNREKFKNTVKSWSEEKKLKIKEKRISTVRKLYEVDFTTQSNIMKQKSKQTWMKKYGVDNPSKDENVIKKIKIKMFQNYGCNFNQRHISADSLEKLHDVEYLISNNHRTFLDIANELAVSYYTVVASFDKYQIPHNAQYNRSQGEIELGNFVSSLGFNIETNVKKIIGRKELDIFIPEKNIAIEYNGLYWHCGKKEYHNEKRKVAVSQNIHLIQVTDYEWMNKRKIVESRIASKLGIHNNKYYARKCEVRTVSPKNSKEFQNLTHIQGAIISKVNLGLYFENELIALMTFGKSRFNNLYEWELHRYSTKLNSMVVGGAAKLFAYFIKKYNPNSIVSFCDLRWNTGELYSKLGFDLIRETGPNYWYTHKYTTFESRVKYQKHKLEKLLDKYDHTKNEFENMIANGYDRFWDCGSRVFEWKSKNTLLIN